MLCFTHGPGSRHADPPLLHRSAREPGWRYREEEDSSPDSKGLRFEEGSGLILP